MELFDFQKKYIEKVKPNWIYDCDTGTGKTIMALSHHKRFFPGKNVLIVAPAAKIQERSWQRTIDEYFSDTVSETCTYNLLSKKYKKYNDWFVIFDEAHRLKNSCGVWGKAGFALSKIACGFILLTATPLSNGWEDSINYFKMFGIVKNKTQFLNTYAIMTRKFGHFEIVGWKNKLDLNYRWKTISKRLNKEDCLDLPDVIVKKVYFSASNKYKAIEKTRVFGEEIFDTQMKLRHGLRLYANLKEKIIYLKEILDSTIENVVIFYNYNEELKLLTENIQKKIFFCNGRQKNIPSKKEWNSTTNTVTLANYNSSSEGIELTYANIVVYFSPTDSYTQFYQSLGRCHRAKQKKKVTVYHFTTKNTVEEKIYNALGQKRDFNWELYNCS